MDFDDLKQWVTAAWDAQAEWRERAEDDFAFVDGHQWTPEEIAALEEQNRVPVVFNRTAIILASVAGSEINNRTEVRYLPREIGDANVNEVLSAGGDWFRDMADAEDADSEAFEHLLVCGIGVTEIGLDWEADPEGMPVARGVEPTEFYWDPHAYRKGLVDARYMGRVRRMPIEEAEARFPDFDAADIDASGWIKADGRADRSRNIIGDEYRDESGEVDAGPDDELTIVQIQWRERVEAVEYVSPVTGERAEMSAEEWQGVPERDIIPHRKFRRWEWRQAFLGAHDILDENQPSPERCTFAVMTGRRDRKERQFYGLLRSMKDPQKYANKWLSQTLHIINANAKGGVMYEEDAVSDPREFEEAWAAADSAQPVRPGALAGGKIQEKPKAQIPAAFMALTEFAVSSIRDVSGVNLELLGLRDANQPGVLEYQRRQSGMTTMARFFDSLKFYRKQQGRIILEFLQRHIAPTGRLVRMVKDGQSQYVPLAVSAGAQRYDVVVDDAPSAPNEKERAWSVLSQMLPLFAQAGLSMEDWADILEYSPLPASFAEKVRAKAASQSKQPDPLREMRMQEMQLELQKTQSEIVENQANAMRDQVASQVQAQEAQLRPMETLAEFMRARAALTNSATQGGALPVARPMVYR